MSASIKNEAKQAKNLGHLYPNLEASTSTRSKKEKGRGKILPENLENGGKLRVEQ